ncbi:Macrolide-specific efflux protein MacA [Minicystis rosea]|nr:Macrolide-specific efflux protein MacA [Minicystis rosea]
MDGRKWLRRLGIVLSVVALVGLSAFWRAKTAPKPPPKYVIGQSTTGDVVETIQSTGQVQPLTQVQVGAQVSGRITKVFVDFNSQVKSGDVLAEIDPTLFGAAIDQNRAQMESAQASVTRAEASLATAKQRLDRAKKLVAEGIGSQADLESAQGAYDVASADLSASRASVAQIGAALKSSRTNLEYTRIFSPIDGVVVTRSIDPGQTVAASFQAPVLFVIAQDLRKMRILADVDEADVGKLKEGMTADVRVDAFPGEKFKGTVSQVRFSPNSTSGVVTYPAVIDVDNPEVKLRPGMTATVTIKTAEDKGATRIPNAALRFKPSPPMDKDGKKIPQEPLPALAAHKGRIYVLVNETPGAEKTEMREVDIGITDGINTVLKTNVGTAKIVVDETDDPSKKKGPF